MSSRSSTTKTQRGLNPPSVCAASAQIRHFLNGTDPVAAPGALESRRRNLPGISRSGHNRVPRKPMLPHRASLEGTPSFSLENSVPKLPLPELNDSLEQYRTFALVFCENDEDRARLSRQIDDARSRLGAAQAALEKRHTTHVNYVEEWWEKYAYLSDRSPIVPQESSTLGFTEVEGSPSMAPALRAAIALRAVAALHDDLRNERYPIPNGKEGPWSMTQFRSIFETCRLPGETYDDRARHFRTAREAAAEGRVARGRHAILGVRGRFYEIPLDHTDLSKGPLSVGALCERIEQAVTDARRHAQDFPGTRRASAVLAEELTDVGYFTGGARDVWARVRQDLIDSDARNADVLLSIETAVSVLTMDEFAHPGSVTECLHELSIPADAGSRWFDKAHQVVVFANGKSGISMEHSVMDAAAHFEMDSRMEKYNLEYLARARESRVGPETVARVEAAAARAEPGAKHLRWGRASAFVRAELATAKRDYQRRRENAWNLRNVRVRGIGKRVLKRCGVSPDSFVQMALQCAYYKIHGRVPSAYESVQVPKFRNGRTEAGRCTSKESAELARLPADAPPQRVGAQLRRAAAVHSAYIQKASNGQGFDRHLFALKCQCLESGTALPELFNDPIFARSSAWDLSTSHAFVDVVQAEEGGTTFRPVAEGSSGVVYALWEDAIDLTVLIMKAREKEFDADVLLSTLVAEMGRLVGALMATSATKL